MSRARPQRQAPYRRRGYRPVSPVSQAPDISQMVMMKPLVVCVRYALTGKLPPQAFIRPAPAEGVSGSSESAPAPP